MMMYLYITAALAMMVGMVLLLGRLISGPSLYDRALAVNSFGTKVVLFLCLFSFIIGRADGVDIAILYTLMNFIATIAILKFFRYRALSGPLTPLPNSKKFDDLRAADNQSGES
ncbi:MAG: monovalent cation/H+ antiporter complex subunit F [Robiginitomaculum sp.]